MPQEFDVVVIGGGPGGYVAAIRAAQKGLRTALVEKDKLGGTCLNIGCIPTKSIIHYIDLYQELKKGVQNKIFDILPTINWPQLIDKSRRVADRLAKSIGYLLRENGVAVFQGYGQAIAPYRIRIRSGEDEQEITYKNLVLATGSEPRGLPGIPFDGDRIISSNEALLMKDLPERLAIIGAGAIGLEFAYIFAAVGVEVSVIEVMPHVLPLEDPEFAELVTAQLKKMKIRFLTDTRLEELQYNETHSNLVLKQGAQSSNLQVDRVLVAIGRQPVVDETTVQSLSLRCEKGFVTTDAQLATGIENVWAIGDMIPTLQLAHAASDEALNVLENLIDQSQLPIDYNLIPRCIYSSPQFAAVGPSRVEDSGARTVVFPYQAIGKAIAIDDYMGKLKLTFNPENGQILAVQIVGAQATELIALYALAMSQQITVQQLAHTCIAHPTLSEIVRESAEMALGLPIHLPPTKS